MCGFQRQLDDRYSPPAIVVTVEDTMADAHGMRVQQNKFIQGSDC